jgi:hypothetical protein
VAFVLLFLICPFTTYESECDSLLSECDFHIVLKGINEFLWMCVGPAPDTRCPFPVGISFKEPTANIQLFSSYVRDSFVFLEKEIAALHCELKVDKYTKTNCDVLFLSSFVKR